MPDYNLAIQVQMEAEEVVSGLQEINNQLSNLPGSVEIAFNTEDNVTPILENIQSSMESLPEEYDITISAEDEASSIIESIQSSMESLPEEYDITISAEDEASSIIESIMERVGEENTYDITISAEDEASDILENIRSQIENIPQEISITITAEDEASSIIESIQSSMESLPEETSITITAEDEASDTIDEVSSKLEEIDGQTATATVDIEGGEETAEQTEQLSLSMKNLGDAAATTAGTILSYQMLVKGLDYTRAIEMAQVYTNATEEQKKAMEKLVQANVSAQLGIDGTAQVMTLLARYTGDASEAMGYFRAVMDAIKITGEDATTVTITLMRTFEEFNISTKDSYEAMARLIQLYNISGYPSFNQFLNVVDRLGITLEQMGYSLEEVAEIVAAVGPQGTMILRGFTTQLYNLNSEWVRGTEKAQEYMNKLGAIGIATRDAQGNIRPLKDVLKDFVDYLEKLPSHEERVKVATEIFGDSMGRALVSIAEGHKKVEKASKESAEQQIKDIKRVKKETLDPLTRIKLELEKLVPGFAGFSKAVADAFTYLLLFASGIYMALRVLTQLDRWFFGNKISEWTSKQFRPAIEWIKTKLPGEFGNALKSSFKEFTKTLGDEIKKAGDFGFGKFEEFARRIGQPLRSKLPSELTTGIRSFGKTLQDEIKRLGDRMVSYVEDFAKRSGSALRRLFGEEGGRISLGWADDLAKYLDDALRGFEFRMPSIVSRAAPRIGSILGRALGEGIGIGLTAVDFLGNAEEYIRNYLDYGFIYAILPELNNFWGRIALYLMSPPLYWMAEAQRQFPPGKLFELAFGPEKWAKMREDILTWARVHLQEPMRRELANFWKDPLRYLQEGYAQMWHDFTTWVATNIPLFKWPKLPSFSMPNLVNLFQQEWMKFTTWVANTIPKFKWPKLPNINIASFRDVFLNIWKQFTDTVTSTFKRFKWPKLPNINIASFRDVFLNIWKQFTDTVTSTFKRFKWPKLPIPDFSDIAKKFYEWGKDFIGRLTKGIWDAMPSLQNALAWIRAHLPHSPPEIGPLADVTEESMYRWMAGITAAGAKALSEFSAMIPQSIESIEIAGSSIQTHTTAAGIGSINVNVAEGAVKIQGSADKETIERAGTMIGRSIVDSLISEGIHARILR